jgi:hypothetical protein
MGYNKQRYATDPEYREKEKARTRAWRKANRLRINAKRRHRYATDPEYVAAARRNTLWWNYGLSWQDFQDMLARQKGACALCRRKFGKQRPCCIDHCHKWRKARRLLCRTCNTGLGCFEDNPLFLRRGADYVEEWRRIHEAQGPPARKSRWKNASKKQKQKSSKKQKQTRNRKDKR